MNGMMVTGTDTGVGKTAILSGLLSLMSEEGHAVAGIRPTYSGHSGDDWPAPLACLRDAAGIDRERDDICPYVFPERIPPEAAARSAGTRIDLERLDRWYTRLASTHAAVLVESAGGLAVPLAQGFTHAHLAARWNLPLLVVARPTDGTLNHAILTVEYARQVGVNVAGVVINGFPARPDEASRQNAEEIERHTDAPVLGVIPHRDTVAIEQGQWRPMRELIRRHLDVPKLLDLLGS